MNPAATEQRTPPMQVNRLPAGGLVDWTKTLGFSFNGVQFVGHPGDTLASALLANGVRLVGRSFKYHRPRGILSAGPEEPNALVELRTSARREPNTRATAIELFDGLSANSQNCWPSVKHDIGSVSSVFAPLLSAGFYYKTFMWPASFWEKLYEPIIRRAAGLGRAAPLPDPDPYEKMFAFCDVLVVGAGAAGLMAALAAGRAGARVILCEEDFRLGGRCLAERQEIGGRRSADWVSEIQHEVAALPEVRILRRTTVFGVYDGCTYGALERVSDHLPSPRIDEPRQRVWQIVAKRCVLATGSIERPLVFGDNDRPGVMLAGAVRCYLNRFGVAPGRRAVVYTNNDDGTRTIADLVTSGVTIVAFVDARARASVSIQRLAADIGFPVFADSVVRRALGYRVLEAVEIVAATGLRRRFDCDLLAMSGGWNPTLHLTSHLGGRPTWCEPLAAFVPNQLPPGMSVAGAANGQFDLESCLQSGAAAGADAVIHCGLTVPKIVVPDVLPESTAIEPLWRTSHIGGKAFVDFQNDVTLADIELAEREGFQSVEHLKRYTTLGMATDQGKTANVNGLAVMAELLGKPIDTVGSTTFRPPYTPVAIGALGGADRGKDFQPTRYTPTHAWSEERGAVFVEAGLWLRARYYPRSAHEDWLDIVKREVTAVRSSVGVCDISTLGKIDIQGRDAAVLLDRVYSNVFSTLPVGKARYGLMLREDGFVFDDGTTSRLGTNHYFMTTTTAHAPKVMQHLEFCHQCLWPELDVQMVSVTEAWAQLAVAGPRSREVLKRLVDSTHDLSNAAFPYLAVAELTICNGINARLFRLSFSGELAYELSVPARYGEAVMRALMECGAEFGITPYGLEALGIMRIEKGHVAGPEISGQTTASDLGLGKLLAKTKDFVGHFMARRPVLTSPARPTLVGFKPVRRTDRLVAGAHLVSQQAEVTAANDQGYLTSVAFSPTLNHWIGLGLLSNGPTRVGEVVRACDPLRRSEILVEVCNPCFVDLKGERLRA